ncbi:catechol 2,3-dioxygenase [Desulfitobacterium sp. AusDCA]|uniref:catechol 2,3-dioxygenase n=1 Tax=Desulfitobacterium sp. AusDCA TaxID=3240383 RepID=UPI003DA6FB46
MTIRGTLRAGLVQIRVLDLEKAVIHYTERLGLDEVCRTSDGRVFLKAYDEFDHHSIVLRQANEAGMDLIGLKVENDAFLTELEQKTKEFGLKYESIPANSDQPGFGRRIAVSLPTGHRLDLYAEVAMSEDHPGLKNPDIWQKEPHGMGVLNFDHALLYGPNTKLAAQYLTEVVGMSKVEVVKGPDGESDLATWLTCNNKAHDIALLEHEQPGKLHHIGFKLESWTEIGHAADLISIHDIALDAGPMRHGVTRGQTIYFFDPSGNRNEVYAGGYAHFPDMPLRVWDFDHVGKGVFYYTRALNERFLNVVT